MHNDKRLSKIIPPMISVKNITKYYTVQVRRKLILDNLSIDIHKGNNLGLLGANGAGKSTLLRIIAGVELPNKGTVTSTASVSWPIGLSNGFTPLLTGKENVQFLCRLFSNSKREMLEKLSFVEEFCELGDYFYMPISTYSSGMKSRLGFGASLAFNFDFVIVDEAMSTGDASFQRKCKKYINEKFESSTLIMVSHSMSTLRQYCYSGIYLKSGELQIYEDISDAIAAYEDDLASVDSKV